jgi:hypothetical protein
MTERQRREFIEEIVEMARYELKELVDDLKSEGWTREDIGLMWKAYDECEEEDEDEDEDSRDDE